mmetsp:Transcript_11350/g.32926  ORF Transcript_11350/g.32926 Transcript_11350/m.32926 type:complete len:209 (-) Transcript_11350:376-1002(-)
MGGIRAAHLLDRVELEYLSDERIAGVLPLGNQSPPVVDHRLENGHDRVQIDVSTGQLSPRSSEHRIAESLGQPCGRQNFSIGLDQEFEAGHTEGQTDPERLAVQHVHQGRHKAGTDQLLPPPLLCESDCWCDDGIAQVGRHGITLADHLDHLAAHEASMTIGSSRRKGRGAGASTLSNPTSSASLTTGSSLWASVACRFASREVAQSQ